jgi:hypothetical protein
VRPEDRRDAHRLELYLGSFGGPAALLASESIRTVELLESPKLGMETIHGNSNLDSAIFNLEVRAPVVFGRAFRHVERSLRLPSRGFET